MREPKPNKLVVPNQRGQQRKVPSPIPATGLLRECHRLASMRLDNFVSTTLDKVDDALFARAEKAENNSRQTHYFDAMRELRRKRAGVEAGFREAFAEGFTQGIPRTRDQGQPPAPFDAPLNLDRNSRDDLGLVGQGQLEESLAVANMAGKLRSNCNSLLFALDQRIGTLLDDPQLERWQNPVGPEAICNAFRSASEVIETGIDIRLTILRLFDQRVVREVRGLYQDLNRFLLQNGVAAEIGASAPRQPPTAGNPVPQPGSTAGSHASIARDNASGSAPSSATPPPDLASQHPSVGIVVLNTLTLLQRDAHMLNASLADAGAAERDPRAAVSGTVNILNGLRQSGIARDLGSPGEMTLGMVAMLFDHILGDQNLQDAMRALIGRLQIPVLKAALLDRDFFANRNHPTRRLLNGMAAIALGWSDQQGTHDPVYRKVSALVQRVLNEFEDNIGLFDTLARDLDRFVAEENARAGVRAERSIRIAEGREQIELARTSALEEVRRSATPGGTTQLVQEFVSGHWKNLLFVICVQHGRDSVEWKSAVQTMHDLIWSVKPKCSLEDRKRLAGLQHDLLQRLRLGMAQLSVPAEEQKLFLTQLVRIHGRTATATDGMEPLQRAAPPPDSAGFAGRAVEAVLAGRQLSLEEINRQPESPAPATSSALQDAFAQSASRLEEGQWLELTGNNGERLRAKLSWVSPATGTCLFTDRQGLKAAVMKRAKLAAELRSQRARVLNDAPLLDRAISRVLKECIQQRQPTP